MSHIKIVDGNSLLFRSFYAMYRPDAPLMCNKDGIPTNAIFIFHRFMKKLKSDLSENDRLIVCFDTHQKTFRAKMMEKYKQQRKPIEPELAVQIPISREMLDALNIAHCELPGYEADDLAGSLTVYAHEKGDVVDLYTSDKDYFQLIQKDVTVNFLRKGLSEVDIYTSDNFHEKFGIESTQITDYKGLVGDSSDNFKGIPGIGEKTAVKLLNTYKDLNEIFAAMKNIKSKTAENILAHEEEGRFCKDLANMVLDLDVAGYYESSLLKPYNEEHLIAFYRKYDLTSFANALKKTADIPTTLEENERADSLGCFSVKFDQNIFEAAVEIKGIREIYDRHPNIFVASYEKKNYHKADLMGLYLSDGKNIYLLKTENIRTDIDLKNFFENPACEYKTYDSKALIVILEGLGIDVKARAVFDLMLATYLIDTNVEDNPKAILESYNYPIRENTDIYEIITGAIISLEAQVLAKLDEFGEKKLYDEIELPLAEVLSAMEIEGVPLDIATIKEFGDSIHKKIEAIKSGINKYTTHDVNLNSPKQVATLLYDELKISKPDKKGSTANDMLLKIKNEHPIIDMLIRYRKYNKLTSSYTDTLPNAVYNDGKIHAMFNQALTTTGRLSMSEPNLQNISIRDEEGKMIRKAFFYPDDNVLFLSYDYSQIELRILAHLTSDQNLLDVFNSGEDIHSSTAGKLFGIPVNEVTPKQRRIAKTVNFSIVYGTTAFGLGEKLEIPASEAKLIIEAFYRTFDKIQDFENSIIKFVQDKGYVLTMMNRRRYLPDIHSNNHMLREFSKRAAVNAVIQGSAADLIKKAMINVAQALKPYETKMILQIHDELIFKVPRKEKEIVKPIIKKAMEEAMTLQVPLYVEGEEGRTWFDAK